MRSLQIDKAIFNLKHTGDKGVPVGWFSISHKWHGSGRAKDPEARKQRRRLRGRWYSIESHQGTIYRVLKFDPTLQFSKDGRSGEMRLDWDGRNALSDFPEGEITLGITPVNFFRTLKCAWDHPNPTDKLALRIALFLGGLSVLLGLVGIVIALL